MAQALKILMVTSEAIPFAKAGGLADVVPTLSRELRRLGHDVRIVMPRYYFIDRGRLKDQGLAVEVDFPERRVAAGVLAQNLPDSQVPVYFLDNDELYGRDGIYGDSAGDYPDNCLRFGFLSRAVFPLCRKLGWIPDIVHAHDWPSAPSLVHAAVGDGGAAFRASAGVFTIHNVGYQGQFGAEQFPLLGLPWSEFRPGSFEFYGRLNFMQGALRHAQKITTVSPTYAKEIMTKELGFGMEGILQERAADVDGVLNGMDYGEWDPAGDRHLVARFDADALAGKAANKRALQDACGFALDPETPVFGIISRLVGQKGFRELAEPGRGSLARILADFPVQFAVLGTGERWCEEEFERLSLVSPKFKLFKTYSERLSHLIQAGSDFFLMPSLYEPCGLTQMYALRYGALPVVAPTGGLADTVADLRADPARATGIHMAWPVSPEGIYQSIRMSLHLWLDKREQLRAMQARGMALRFTWEKSCRRYEELYRQALAVKRESGALSVR